MNNLYLAVNYASRLRLCFCPSSTILILSPCFFYVYPYFSVIIFFSRLLQLSCPTLNILCYFPTSFRLFSFIYYTTLIHLLRIFEKNILFSKISPFSYESNGTRVALSFFALRLFFSCRFSINSSKIFIYSSYSIG